MHFEKLFTPGKIGTLDVSNRLVVPPMLTEYAAEDGSLTERYIRYYEEKARGGWGLIICEDNSVDPYGAGFKHIAGLWSDAFMPAHAGLVERVHKYGAKNRRSGLPCGTGIRQFHPWTPSRGPFCHSGSDQAGNPA